MVAVSRTVHGEKRGTADSHPALRAFVVGVHGRTGYSKRPG